jgi:hypothetical protein
VNNANGGDPALAKQGIAANGSAVTMHEAAW